MIPCNWSNNPTHFECTRCKQRNVPREEIEVLPYRRTCGVQPSRGLGDTLAKLFRAVGIEWLARKLNPPQEGCGGCKRRQRKLNSLVPYDRKAWKWRLLWPWLFVAELMRRRQR